MSEPKFRIRTRLDDEFYFTLVARNGEVIAVSEGYKTKDGCKNGIEAVKREAPDAVILDDTQ